MSDAYITKNGHDKHSIRDVVQMHEARHAESLKSIAILVGISVSIAIGIYPAMQYTETPLERFTIAVVAFIAELLFFAAIIIERKRLENARDKVYYGQAELADIPENLVLFNSPHITFGLSPFAPILGAVVCGMVAYKYHAAFLAMLRALYP